MNNSARHQYNIKMLTHHTNRQDILTFADKYTNILGFSKLHIKYYFFSKLKYFRDSLSICVTIQQS